MKLYSRSSRTRLHFAPVIASGLLAGLIGVAVGCHQPSPLPDDSESATTRAPLDPVEAGSMAESPGSESFQDWNGNGIDDAIDISYRTSLDENNNGIPDEAEPTDEEPGMPR